MEIIFKNKRLEDIYTSGKETGKPVYGSEVVHGFIKKVAIIAGAGNSVELAKFKSLHLEALKKEEKYRGMHSIRVNDKYRLILKIVKQKTGAESVEISEIHDLTDYH